MITLKVNNSTFFYSGDEASFIKDKLQIVCSYKAEGVEYSDLYKSGRWDGRTSLMSKLGIPTGLLSKVCKMFKDEGISYKIVDERVRPDDVTPIPFTGDSRYYQEMEGEMKRISRGLILASVGAGKTAIMARFFAQNPVNTLCLVPGKELLYQNAKAFENFTGVEWGLVGDGNKDYSKKYIVATIQTLWRNREKQEVKDLLNRTQSILIDEVDFAGSESCYRLVMACNAYYKWGFTGTLREDGKDLMLIACTGKIYTEIGTSKLIEENYLNKIDVNIYDLKLSGVAAIGMPDEVYRSCITQNEERNKNIIKIAIDRINAGKKVLIIVRHLEHGEILEEMLCKIVPSTIFIHGKTKSLVRRKAYNDICNGTIKCLIVTEITKRGVNMPELDCLIYARAGKTRRTLVQFYGRVLRMAKGKNTSELIDFTDNFHRIFRKQYKGRLDVYTSERAFNIKIVGG